MRQVEATDEEEAELQRGLQGVSRAIYESDETSDALLSMVEPGGPEGVVGGASRAVIQLVTELDKKLDLDKAVLAQLGARAADRFIELVEAEKGIDVSDQEARQIVMTVEEGLLQAYGMDEEASGRMVNGMSDAEYQGLQQLYTDTLGTGMGVGDEPQS